MTAAPSRWRELLALALPALDYVYGEKDPAVDPDWTLGGGTAIAIGLNHRVSFDIDIFLQHGRLKSLTPAENPAAGRISDRFQWPGHYLKFERPEGEVDFVSAVLQTEPGYAVRQINGRPIAVETPEEVVIKKIRFRSERFTPRDAFDLAAVARANDELANILAREVPDTLPRLDESLRVVEQRGLSALRQAVVLVDGRDDLLPTTFDIARQIVADARVRSGIH